MGSRYGFAINVVFGGQYLPRSIAGLRELWRKFQNMLVNRRASEMMNSANLSFSVFSMGLLWRPRRDLSRFTELHHIIDDEITNVSLRR